MGYWLGRLAVPGTLIPALDQTRQFPCVRTRTKSEKATVKASPAFLFQCLRAPQWNDLFERVFHSPALFSISLQRLQRWQLWCWLLRCIYTVHWHCTKMINRLFTWATVSWGQIQPLWALSCVQIIHMGDKNLHILLPILQVTYSSILLNKVELTGYELWLFGFWFLTFFLPSLFKGRKKKRMKC